MTRSERTGSVTGGAILVGGAVMGGALLVALSIPAPTPDDQSGMVTVTTGDPYVVTIADCTPDGHTYPCGTIRGQVWTVRWSDTTDSLITACPTEDGGPDLPCIHTHPAPGGWLVFTDRFGIGVAQ